MCCRRELKLECSINLLSSTLICVESWNHFLFVWLVGFIVFFCVCMIFLSHSTEAWLGRNLWVTHCLHLSSLVFSESRRTGLCFRRHFLMFPHCSPLGRVNTSLYSPGTNSLGAGERTQASKQKRSAGLPTVSAPYSSVTLGYPSLSFFSAKWHGEWGGSA